MHYEGDIYRIKESLTKRNDILTNKNTYKIDIDNDIYYINDHENIFSEMFLNDDINYIKKILIKLNNKGNTEIFIERNNNKRVSIESSYLDFFGKSVHYISVRSESNTDNKQLWRNLYELSMQVIKEEYNKEEIIKNLFNSLKAFIKGIESGVLIFEKNNDCLYSLKFDADFSLKNFFSHFSKNSFNKEISIVEKKYFKKLPFVVFCPIKIWNEKNIGAFYLLLNSNKMRLNNEETFILNIYINFLTEFIYHLQREKSFEVESNLIYFQATHSDVTGLPNELYLKDIYSQQMIESKEKIAFINLDIENFIHIKNIYGLNFANEIKIKFVSEIFKSLNEKDKFVELSEENFLILFPFAEKEEIEDFVERLDFIFDKPIIIDDQPQLLKISSGISIFPEDNEKIEMLIRYSKIASIENNDSDRTKHFFKKEYLKSLNKRLKIEKKLFALIQDGKGLDIHYQPIIDFQKNKAIALEALARWNDPELGQIEPEEFIKHSERNGAIHKLGKIVVRKVISQIKKWEKKGINIPVYVNVSVKELKRFDFVQDIKKLLNESKIKRGMLGIEITESSFMEDVNDTIKKLQELRKEGIKISIDDFGTGYSSFLYLKDLPADIIKIDKAFIDNVCDNFCINKSMAIIKSIIALSKNLNLKTIAEGIEHEKQRENLGSVNCDYYQGYLFCRPEPQEVIEKYLLD